MEVIGSNPISPTIQKASAIADAFCMEDCMGTYAKDALSEYEQIVAILINVAI